MSQVISHELNNKKEINASGSDDDVSYGAKKYYDKTGVLLRTDYHWGNGERWMTVYNTERTAQRLADWEEVAREAEIEAECQYKLWEIRDRSGRNTKKVPRKVRTWCFTLNNYNEEDIKNLLEAFKKCRYVFQEEKGDEGTEHLQGCVTFKNQVYFSKVKEICEKAHWEVARNTIKAREYCRKEDSRNGKIYTNI